MTRKDDARDTQKHLLDQVERALGPHINLADTLSEWLGISRGNAYKKIRGETMLTLNDLVVLQRRCPLDLPSAVHSDQALVQFQANMVRKRPESALAYLENLHRHITTLSEIEDVSFHYVANQLPIFHLLPFKKLLAFKLYIWDICNWKNEKPLQTFDLSDDLYRLDTDAQRVCQRIIEAYYQYEGTEIWSRRLLDSTYAQIRYLMDINLIDKDNTVQLLMEELADLITYLEKMAITGEKSVPNTEIRSQNIIFVNQMIESTEIIYIYSNDQCSTYLSYDPPHYMLSTDGRLGDYTKQYFDTLLEYADLISKHGARSRIPYFDYLRSEYDKHLEMVRAQ